MFDTARNLLIIELVDNAEISRQVVGIPNIPPVQKAQFVHHTGLQLLICGAVSRYLERHLQAQGVEVLPWIRGSIDGVLAAYCSDQLECNAFRSPGCRGQRCQRRRGAGNRYNNNRNKTTQEDT